jgi:drug/metabolite transporter (DMT)-like permease
MKPLLAGAGPLTLAWLRLLPAGLVLLLAARLWRGGCRVDRRDWLWLLLFSLIDATAFQGLLARGLAGTGAGLGSVLIDSQPLAVALLARSLFGEAINPVGWFGLLLGLLGILCLGLPVPVLRHWWLMGPAALAERPWSHGQGSRYACRHSDPLAVTGWHLLLGSLPLLLVSALAPLLDPAANAFWPAWSGLDWALMAYASLLGSALAYGLFFWFASSGDLTSFTSLTFLTPVFALLCGVALLGEGLQPLQWAGVLLALVSVLLINRRASLWHPAAEVMP